MSKDHDNSGDKDSETADAFIGSSWGVRKVEGKFILRYISGELGGELKELEITKEEFEAVCAGKLDANRICLKYGVS